MTVSSPSLPDLPDETERVVSDLVSDLVEAEDSVVVSVASEATTEVAPEPADLLPSTPTTPRLSLLWALKCILHIAFSVRRNSFKGGGCGILRIEARE